MSNLEIKGNSNANNILAGRDYIALNFNSLEYKPCPVCQKSWIEKAKDICNNCQKELNASAERNRRRRISSQIRLGIFSWMFIAFVITVIVFYSTYNPSDEMLDTINNFNHICAYSLLISAFIIAFFYALFIFYRKLKSSLWRKQ